METNMKKWKQNILSGERKALPILTYPGLSLINKTVSDVVSNGEIQYQLIKAISDRYPTPAAVGLMDLSVEAEAFGSEIFYGDKEIPNVLGRLVTDENSIKALKVPDMTQGRLPEYIKANALCVQNIERSVLGGVIGPYSLASRLFGMSEIMVAIRRNPKIINFLLLKCTELITAYALAIKKTGAHGVIMAEPAAGLLSEEYCYKFSSFFIKMIIDAVQDDSFIVILHNCGPAQHLLKAMLFTGAEGYHFGNTVDITEILPKMPKDKLVVGNLDPVNVFKLGTNYSIIKKTSMLLERTMQYPNFVISSGCDIPPGTPIKNIDTFFQILALYNEHVISHQSF